MFFAAFSPTFAHGEGMPNVSKVSSFAAVPDADELAEMERRFQFCPVQNDAPSSLSLKDIEFFNREGYLTGVSLLSDDDVQELRSYFDRLLDLTLRQGGTSYSISTAHLKFGRVHDLLTDTRLKDLMADLIGPDVIGWGSHFFCKMPGDGKSVAWHQDASYWPMSTSKTLTVWLAVDDSDLENGCMKVIPGSHLNGQLGYRSSQKEEQNVLNQTIEAAADWPDPVPICLKAGQISIHSDLLVHGSDINPSSRRRCGLTLRYCSPDVRAGNGWNEKGVWVAGADDSGHWNNAERPDQD